LNLLGFSDKLELAFRVGLGAWFQAKVVYPSKYMHAFYVANRQTNRQTRAKTFTSSFVGDNKGATIY